LKLASTPIPNPPEHSRARPTPLREPSVETSDPQARVLQTNAAARVQPRRSISGDAQQVYVFEEGALYQVYAAPGRITDITLQPGEALSSTGPVAAGDTVRWVIGNSQSGAGAMARIHILLKPTRVGLLTNLVLNTDRRTYHLELHATPTAYMPTVAWRYPEDEARARAAAVQQAAPPTTAVGALNFGYRIGGDAAPWRPTRVFDDGRKTVIEFPPSVSQSEMPPLFIAGPDGKATELVNYRVVGHRMVLDRLFSRAELRLGAGRHQVCVRLERDGA
jgi:type IV secretion system protein VirB9